MIRHVIEHDYSRSVSRRWRSVSLTFALRHVATPTEITSFHYPGESMPPPKNRLDGSASHGVVISITW